MPVTGDCVFAVAGRGPNWLWSAESRQEARFAIVFRYDKACLVTETRCTSHIDTKERCPGCGGNLVRVVVVETDSRGGRLELPGKAVACSGSCRVDENYDGNVSAIPRA